MPRFTLERVEYFDHCKIKVSKLLINDKCQYDEFQAEITQDGTYTEELERLEALLELSCNLETLPKKQFRRIHWPERTHIYEIKSNNVRLYCFHDSGTGRIIVIGGKKTNQDADIKMVKKIVKTYINTHQ